MMLANCREHLTPNANGQIDQLMGRGLGFTPSWNLSTDPAVNYHINPNVVFPPGMDQFTIQPVTFNANARNELRGLGQGSMPAWFGALYGVLSVVSAGLGAYHGYKRHNGSVGWAIGWAALGTFAPVITPAVALAQGFGKPMKR